MLIQSLWIGDKLSIMQQLCIISFLQNGHSYSLYVYDQVKNIPQGAVVEDANKIVPAERIFRYKDYDSCAGFANLFRYKLLLEKGGYWVDTDVVCLKPFDFGSDYVFARVGERGRVLDNLVGRLHIPTWLIKAPKGSGLMEYCYHEALKRDPKELAWGETGRPLITTAVYNFGFKKYVVRPYTFFPIYWWQWEELINASLIATCKWRIVGSISYAVHLYHEMWRRNNVDGDALFPENSIYERLKRRYFGRL
jgi:hypothetical protein